MAVLYTCVTEKPGAKPYTRWHIVWDAQLFLRTQRTELAKTDGIIAVMTEQEYRDEKWPEARGRRT